MSKLADALRERKIFNTHGLLAEFGEAGKDVGVMFNSADHRSCHPACSHIYSPSFKTAPNSPWYDYQQKSFVGIKRESHPKALAWAEETYGVKFVPGPFGDYIPIEVLAKAKQYVKEPA